MASELSQEMRQELLQELRNDNQRMTEKLTQMANWNVLSGPNINPSYADLEQLTYITEQIRLKLRLLGAPRIYQ